MAEKTNVYSNYLIDISKKGIVSPTGKSPAITQFDTIDSLGQAFLRGDLKTDFFKNVGFEYKESFTEYDKEIKAKFDKLTNAVKDLLGFMMKGNKFDLSANDLRGRIIDIELLFHYFTGDDKGSYDNLKAIVEQYNYIAAYKVPARKKIPTIEISKLDSIVFEFAFGKCNLFDAKKEVWEPLTYIKEKLLPNPRESDIPGMYKVDGLGDGIPYTNFALVDLVKGMSEVSSTLLFKGGGNVTPNSIMKKLQDSGKFISKVTNDAKEDFVSYLNDYVEGLKMTGEGGYAPETTAHFSDTYVELRNKLKDNKKNINALLEKAGLAANFNEAWFEEYDISKVEADRSWWDNIVASFGGAVNEKGVRSKVSYNVGGTNSYEWDLKQKSGVTPDSKIKNDPNIKVTLKDGGDTSNVKDYNIEVVDQEAQKSAIDSIEDILKNIATLDVRTGGLAIKNAYENIMAHTDKRFWLGCGYVPQFAHSLTQFSYSNKKGFDNPRILYGPFVIKELKIDMDIYDLDQNGYPMSGKVTIVPWNLHTYGKGLQFGI